MHLLGLPAFVVTLSRQARWGALWLFCTLAASLPAQIPTLPEIAANRSLWPREVALRQAVRMPIVQQGREIGSVPLPAGGVYRVVQVEPTQITLEANGNTLRVLPSQTDLLARVVAKLYPAAPAPAAQPPPSAPAPPVPPSPASSSAPQPGSTLAPTPTAGPAAAATSLPTAAGWHRKIHLPSLPKAPVALPGVQGDLKPEAEVFDLYLPRDFDPKRPSGLIVYVSPAENPDIPERYRELWDERGLIVIGAYRTGNTEKVERRAGLAISAQLALRQIYQIDPARVFASGMSGGGRMATRLGFMAPQYFKGVLAHCGADFYKDYHVTQKSAQKRPSSQGNYWPGFAGNQHATPGAVAQARTGTRFVLLSGPEDIARNHEDWEAALKADGFKVLLVMQPGLGHDFCSVESYRRGLDFVLGGK